MSDLRTLLDRAVGEGAGFDYRALVVRARRRRQRRRVAGAAAALAAVAAIVVPVGTDDAPDRRLDTVDTPDERRDGSSMDDPSDSGRIPGRLPVPGVLDRGGLLPGGDGHPASSTSTTSAPASLGGHIAYAHGGDVYVADLDGTDRRLLARDATSPAWSPDGTRVAVAQAVPSGVTDPASAPRQLVVVEVASGRSTVVRDVRGITSGFSIDSPTWAPGGERLVFVQRYCNGGTDLSSGSATPCRTDRPRPGDYDSRTWSELRSVNVDGSSERLIASAGNTFHESPSFSPYGNRIVYATAVVGGEWDIVVANGDGTSPNNLTLDPFGSLGNVFDPAWSPKGGWLVAAGDAFNGDVRNGQRWMLVTMRPNGTDRSTLSWSGWWSTEPAWGPTEDYIVFTRRGGPDRSPGELHVILPGVTEAQRAMPGSFASVRPEPGG